MLGNPKLTDIGKFMLFESLPAFKFGMTHPERFNSWNLEKMSTNDEVLELAANEEEISYAFAMEMMRRNDENEEPSPKNKRK